MTSTTNAACPLCGLRFASRPLLDLHIREDHRPRAHRVPAEPAPEVATMTVTSRPRLAAGKHDKHRLWHALRYVNDELTRAGEAIIRSARAPRPRPPVSAGNRDTTAANRDTTSTNRDTTAERIGRAA